MKSLNRWARAGGGAVLGIALFGMAPAAHAITNPADHPAPITVTIGGQAYHDGEDTLPGYDDEACTPIPNVQYDFGSNEIQYYGDDGDLVTTASWTEWDRISSYRVWLAQQRTGSGSRTPTTTTPTPSNPAPSNPAPSNPAPSNPAPSNPAPSSPAPSSAAPTGSGTKTTGSGTKTTGSGTKTTGSGTKTTSSGGKKSSGTKTTGSGTKTTSSGGKKSSGTKTTGSGTKTTSSDGKTTTPGTTKQAASSNGGKGATAAKSGNATNGTAANGTAKNGAAADGAGGDGSGGDAAAASNGSSSSGGGTTSSGSPGASPTQNPETAADYRLVSSPADAVDTRLAGELILAALAAITGLAFLFGFGKRSLLGRRDADGPQP